MTEPEPVLTLRVGHADRVAGGRATALILHTQAFPWISSLEAGSTFTVAGAGPHGA